MKDARTYRDRAEYLKKAVALRRKVLRLRAIDYKGAQCEICHYRKCYDALEFHHKDPNKKDFGISASGTTKSWVRIKNEIEKCLLVCANCHREIHAKINSSPIE